MSILDRLIRPKQPTRAQIITAAQDRLPVLMARQIARDAQRRSDRTRAGNITKAARRAGA